jgi:hypothetical protein
LTARRAPPTRRPNAPEAPAAVDAPTLVLQDTDQLVDVSGGRALARAILAIFGPALGCWNRSEYQGPPPYDLRASFVSLLVWEGRTMIEVAGQAGHSVDVCETYYARIFEGYDPTKRTSAEQAIRAARQSEGRAMDVIRGEAETQS